MRWLALSWGLPAGSRPRAFGAESSLLVGSSWGGWSASSEAQASPVHVVSFCGLVNVRLLLVKGCGAQTGKVEPLSRCRRAGGLLMWIRYGHYTSFYWLFLGRSNKKKSWGKAKSWIGPWLVYERTEGAALRLPCSGNENNGSGECVGWSCGVCGVDDSNSAGS